MVAASEGRIRASLLLGGNLFSSNPDREWSKSALRNIPFSAGITTKLNEGYIHGRAQTQIIFPALARDEEAQATTQESMFNFVRLSEGGTPSVEGEMRSEVDIIASIAERILPKARFDWNALRSHRRLREQIARVVPGWSAIGEIDQSKAEFQIAGRTFHSPRFHTPDGRAHFHVTPIPASEIAPGEFRLMTLRSEGQFNTVVYEEEDLYRGNSRRDVVMMSAGDAGRLGLVEGSPVRVKTESGQMDVLVAISELPSGNLAMYYPEANVLVPRILDKQSRTPAFKSVSARVVVP
jgi:anaerobic selenocysteine-containing dehydrogenase